MQLKEPPFGTVTYFFFDFILLRLIWFPRITKDPQGIYEYSKAV